MLTQAAGNEGRSIFTCAKEGDLLGVTKAIESGVDINSTDHDKESALMISVDNNNAGLAEFLLISGADPNIENKVISFDFINAYDKFLYFKAA